MDGNYYVTTYSREEAVTETQNEYSSINFNSKMCYHEMVQGISIREKLFIDGDLNRYVGTNRNGLVYIQDFGLEKVKK